MIDFKKKVSRESFHRFSESHDLLLQILNNNYLLIINLRVKHKVTHIWNERRSLKNIKGENQSVIQELKLGKKRNYLGLFTGF